MTIFKPLVTIIIPTWRSDATIIDAVNSVLAQTYRKFELLIMSDETSDFLRDRIAQINDDRVQLHEHEKSSQSKALNRSIKISNGKYICLLDADDMWLPQKLERQIATIKNNLLSFTSVLLMDSNNRIYHAKEHIYWQNNIKKYWMRKRFIVPSSIMIDTNLFQTVGIYNEKMDYCEDMEFILRIFEYTDKIISLQEYLTIHRVDHRSKTFHVGNNEYMKMLIWRHHLAHTDALRFMNLRVFILRFVTKYIIKNGSYYSKIPIREQKEHGPQFPI